MVIIFKARFKKIYFLEKNQTVILFYIIYLFTYFSKILMVIERIHWRTTSNKLNLNMKEA